MEVLILNLIDKIRRKWSYAPSVATADMPKLYGQSPRLDPVRYIAKTCASEELKLYKKSDWRKNGENAEVLGEHELYDLLENPCPTFPELDGWTLRYLTFAYIDLVGECGWLKVREGRRIVALLPIPASWILQKPTVGNHFYQVMPYGSVGGVTLTVDPKDFVYFKDVDLTDPYGNGKGMSESIADELETDEYASKYQKNFFFNDATPPYIVTGYQGNEQGADRLKKSLKEKIGGFRKAREPAILTGAMDIKPIGIAPKELDMVESRRFLRDECLQHYQLPPEIFGIVENSNRATIDSSFYLTQKNVIIPRLKFFERVINAQLLNEFDDLIALHKVQVIEDKDLQLRIYSFGVQNGCITREQFCEQFGINPDPEEGHYIISMGQSVVPVGEEIDLENIPVETPAEENEEEIEIDENPDETTDENTDESNDEEEPKGKSVVSFQLKKKIERDEWREKIWKGFDEKARSKESDFIKAVKKIASKQKLEIKELIKGLNAVNDTTVNNLVMNYYDESVDEKVKHSLAGSWLDSLRAGRENAKEALNGKKTIEFDDVMITNDLFNKWVEKYGLSKSAEINQTSRKQLLKALRESLAESVAEGDGLEETKKKLQKSAESVFAELSDVRAYMIARTETASTVNAGQVATYKADGIEQKEWLATLDDRTRDWHLAMNGKTVAVDSPFEVTLEDGSFETVLYPADPSGSAGNTINCRCSVAPVIKF